MPMTPKQMIRLLEQNGFVLVSANGSHYKYHNPTTNKTTVVPFHAKDLKPGTEKNILKLPDLLQTALLEMIEWWEPGAAAKAMEMLIAEEQKRIRREKLTALNERKERIREKAEKQLRTLLKSALAVPEEERAHLCKQKKSERYRRSKTRRFSKRFPS